MSLRAMGFETGNAKNFPIFLTQGGYRLTPIYDLTSSLS